MIKTFFKLLFNIGKEMEIFTKVSDFKNEKLEFFYKSNHKGVLKLDKRGFYLKCDTYRIPVYANLSVEKKFGIETKYVFI